MTLFKKQCFRAALFAVAMGLSFAAELSVAEPGAAKKVAPGKTGQETGPKTVIKEIFEKAKSERLADDDQLQQDISSHINFKKMAGEVLKGQAAPVATQENEWFSQTLSELIQLTVYPQASSFLDGVKITYVDQMKNSERASVTSELEKKGEITEVKYTLIKSGSSWEVIDVAIDDESWVESIRDEVRGVIAESQWAGLKKRMTSRLNELKAKKKSKKKPENTSMNSSHVQSKKS